MKLCIFGAGGFGKEVFWLAKQCGYEVDAFIDSHKTGYCCNTKIEKDDYFDPSQHLAVVAIGSPQIRQKIVQHIIDQYGDQVFVTLISPSANIMDPNIKIGKGSVICANCILTCDIELGPWSQLNLATTIGHDCVLGSFFTTAPGVHISGKVLTGANVYLGTNASVIEAINICGEVTVGASACVAKHITEPGTYVGIPAKKMEKKNV